MASTIDPFLTYGARKLALGPAPGDARVLLPGDMPPQEPQDGLVRRALKKPIGSPALAEMARGRRSAIILIACRTRRTGSEVFVPEIVRVLNGAGIADERILVYAATGTHDNWRAEDAALLAGANCARRLRFVGHDCRNDLREVGTTSRGNRVRLSRAYLDADLKIATGRVTHHYFAGFTGGRKAILPGVAGFESIVFNHRLASCTEPAIALHPGARNGVLDGNPVHLDMLEAARLAPPDFTLCTVLDPRNEIARAFGGELEAAHAVAVDEVRVRDAPGVAAPADWMFLSCGGAHCDVNAVQTLKALVHNYEAVRPGGAIILAAECAEGIAPWLRQLCDASARGELERRAQAGDLRHPHNALFLRAATEHARVIMVASLATEDVQALGFRKAQSLDAAVALAKELAGPPRTTFIVPYGNTTVVRVTTAERSAKAVA